MLDSGCSKTIILKEFCFNQHQGEKITYQTYGGTITSKANSNVKLKLTEFSNSKTINFMCQVDSHNKSKNSPYDIILGSDFMSALGIDLSYSKRIIQLGRRSTTNEIIRNANRPRYM